MQHAATIEGGFADPILGAQSVFRAAVDAMAKPGHAVAIAAPLAPPAPLAPVAAAVACTLFDADTAFWLDQPLAENAQVPQWLKFQTGARLADTIETADFALVANPRGMPTLERFAQGTHEYPDRSATLILQIDALIGGAAMTFAGPGIRSEVTFAPQGLPQSFLQQWRANAERFPRGVDLVFAAPDAIACLPRSAKLVNSGS